MENIKKFKKYIYVSSKKQVELEEMCKQKSIYLQIAFINTYNFGTLFQDGLKNLNGVDYLFLDVNAIVDSIKNSQDIIYGLTLMRKMYPELRIIIIAEGYKTGDTLLGKIFNLGIYNIVTAENNLQFVAELEKTISEEGMTFGNSMKYKVDFNISVGNNTTKVQKEFVRAKQIVTIGVCSTERHLGATTLAINICKFLSEYPNERVCYIENNNHNTIKSLKMMGGSIYYEKQRKVEYAGIDFFQRPESIASIQKYDYSFYIYDCGNFDEMTKEEKDIFLTRDIKFVVTASRIWEYAGIVNCLIGLENSENSYFYINHTNLDERENFKNSNFEKKWFDRIYFSPENANPYSITSENREFYKKIFEPYLLNTKIEEKKKGLKGLFSRNKKEGK